MPSPHTFPSFESFLNDGPRSPVTLCSSLRKPKKTKCMRRSNKNEEPVLLEKCLLYMFWHWSFQKDDPNLKKVFKTSCDHQLETRIVVVLDSFGNPSSGLFPHDVNPESWIEKKGFHDPNMLRVLDIYPHLVYNKKCGKNIGKSSSPMEPIGLLDRTPKPWKLRKAPYFPLRKPRGAPASRFLDVTSSRRPRWNFSPVARSNTIWWSKRRRGKRTEIHRGSLL